MSFDDANGSTHSVLVTARSLYEAVALALQGFQGQSWTPPVPPLARLRVEVSQAAVTHTVTADQVRQWAAAPARSPAEKLTKDRVKRLVATT